jgi:hypothetical protein
MGNKSGLLTKEIISLLNTKITNYRLYQYFINSYLTNIANIKPKMAPGHKAGGAKKDPSLFQKIKSDPFYLYLFKGGKKKPSIRKYDLVFISRFRPASKGGTKRDYLFKDMVDKVSKDNKTAFLTLDLFTDRYDYKGVDNYILSDFLTFRMFTKSFFKSRKIGRKYRGIRKKLSEEQREVCDGFFSPLNIRFWCLIDLLYGSSFKALRPKVLVSNNECILNHKSDIIDSRMIVVQSAMMIGEKEKLRGELFRPFIREKDKSDVFCVGGVYFKDLLEKYGVETKQVQITGQPRFDDIHSEYLAKKSSKKKGLAEGDIKILWATQTHGITEEENKRNLKVMEHVLENFKNIELGIKLHPVEDQEAPLYQPLKRKYKNFKVYSKDKDFYRLLNNHDIFITKDSAAIIEAAIFDKEIIIVDFKSKQKNMFYELGVGALIDDEKKVKKVMGDLLKGTGMDRELAVRRKRFVELFNHKNDGKANERIIKLIKEML